MLVSWIIFGFCVLVFAYRGYRQGVLGALSRVFGLVGGYWLAIAYGGALGAWLQANTGLQGMGAYIIGGLIVFFAASTLIGLLFSLAQRVLDAGKKRSGLASGLGLVTGAGIGAVFGLIAVFAVGYFLDVFSVMQPGASAQPTRQISSIEKFSKYLAGNVIEFATTSANAEPSTAKLSAALATDPAAVVSGLQQVAQNPAAKSLFNDPENQQVLTSRDANAIANLPDFQTLAKNPNIQRLAELSGMDTSNQTAFEQELAQQAGGMWGKAQQLKNDPEVQSILRDPDFQAQLQSKNPVALMNDPRFMTLFSRLLASSDADSSTVLNGQESNQTINNETPDQKPSEDTPMYRWVDDNGQVHYSDKPPK